MKTLPSDKPVKPRVWKVTLTNQYWIKANTEELARDKAFEIHRDPESAEPEVRVRQLYGKEAEKIMRYCW